MNETRRTWGKAPRNVSGREKILSRQLDICQRQARRQARCRLLPSCLPNEVGGEFNESDARIPGRETRRFGRRPPPVNHEIVLITVPARSPILYLTSNSSKRPHESLISKVSQNVTTREFQGSCLLGTLRHDFAISKYRRKAGQAAHLPHPSRREASDAQ